MIMGKICPFLINNIGGAIAASQLIDQVNRIHELTALEKRYRELERKKAEYRNRNQSKQASDH